MNIMPTSYTHRQIIAGAQIMTSRRVLQVILDEIRSHTEAGNANIIYDVAIALVCAPDVSNQPPAASIEDPSEAGAAAQPLALQRRLTLRDALRMEAEDFKKTQKKDAVLAEITLRLHRKVEAQMALPPPAELPQLLQPTDMTLPIAMDAAAEASLNETMAAMGDGAQLDLDLPVIDGLGGGPGGADGDGVGDDFFGLDGNLDDFNWSNDMDLS
jgi:mediator of RNA polymerase II transcription subunit 5